MNKSIFLRGLPRTYLECLVQRVKNIYAHNLNNCVTVCLVQAVCSDCPKQLMETLVWLPLLEPHNLSVNHLWALLETTDITPPKPGRVLLKHLTCLNKMTCRSFRVTGRNRLYFMISTRGVPVSKWLLSYAVCSSWLHTRKQWRW